MRSAIMSIGRCAISASWRLPRWMRASAPSRLRLRGDASPAPPRRPKPKLETWQFAALGAVLVLIAVGVFVLVFSRGGAERPASAAAPEAQTPPSTRLTGSPASPRESTAPQASTPAKPRIAILPFENLSPDPNNAFFTDGMHEEILTALANGAPGLEVISRTTMDSYKGKPVSVEQLAKDLNCTYVMEGSVRREGNEVRLTLQLIDASNDSHVWAQDYDRKLVSAMTLQSEVAKQVATQLSVQLTPSAQDIASPTTDPLVYDLYLKARLALQRLSNNDTISAWRTVEQQLDQAIKLDPNFTDAYLQRFDLHVFMFLQNYDTSPEILAQIQADLAAAQRLAPANADVLIAEAQWAELDQDFDRALALLAEAEAKGQASAEALLLNADILVRKGLAPDAL